MHMSHICGKMVHNYLKALPVDLPFLYGIKVSSVLECLCASESDSTFIVAALTTRPTRRSSVVNSSALTRTV